MDKFLKTERNFFRNICELKKPQGIVQNEAESGGVQNGEGLVGFDGNKKKMKYCGYNMRKGNEDSKDKQVPEEVLDLKDVNGHPEHVEVALPKLGLGGDGCLGMVRFREWFGVMTALLEERREEVGGRSGRRMKDVWLRTKQV